MVPGRVRSGRPGTWCAAGHLALPLIGRGEVEFHGHVPALLALREAGLEPLRLEAKEGLALLNGTQMMGAVGALVLADADRLTRTASVVAAMSVEALLGTEVAFAAAYQLARPHPGQVAVATELRHLLRHSTLQASHHGHAHKVQDPYSLRCVPQVHGAVRDALGYLGRVLDIELNSATDNPLIFPGGGVAPADAVATGGGLVISGGNFHGEPIALALDFAKIAIAELGSISERRTALLVDPRLNGGLPAFLAASSGVDSGMMIYQYTAAALVSENKVLAHPASVDSIPTSANQEDHVSMGSIAARHARMVLDNAERVLAIELLVAAQALDARLALLPGTAPGAGVLEAHRRIRAVVPRLEGDREPGPDLAAATTLVRTGALADLVGRASVCELRPRERRPPDRRRYGCGGIRARAAVRRREPIRNHRSCDATGRTRTAARAAQLSWLSTGAGRRHYRAPARLDRATFADEDAAPLANPFAFGSRGAAPLRAWAADREPVPPRRRASAGNPFTPAPGGLARRWGRDAPRKLGLLGRGLGIFRELRQRSSSSGIEAGRPTLVRRPGYPRRSACASTSAGRAARPP